MAVIQLRGGTGSAIMTTKVAPKRQRGQKAIDVNREKLDKKCDEEVEAEVAAMKRHKEVRPDKQKIAF